MGYCKFICRSDIERAINHEDLSFEIHVLVQLLLLNVENSDDVITVLTEEGFSIKLRQNFKTLVDLREETEPKNTAQLMNQFP